MKQSNTSQWVIYNSIRSHWINLVTFKFSLINVFKTDLSYK
jgi:hypothetical protein